MTPAPVIVMASKSGGLALARLLCESEQLPSPAAILCPDDRADARSCLGDFESLARRHAVPLHLVERIDQLELLLGDAEPATVLVHGWYRIIPGVLLARHRFLGFHYSALPAYRGNAPLVWQILRGEPELGLSFFRFAPGMDEGDLLAQRRFPLGLDESIGDAIARAEALCLEMVRTTLPAWLQGRHALQPQAAEGASYCGLRLPADGRIDWRQDARRVHDFVRAQARPYPGAFTTLGDGATLRIWRTRPDPRPFFGVPGAVVAVEGDEVLVACGDERALQVAECSVDGRGPDRPARLIGSLRVRLGGLPPLT